MKRAPAIGLWTLMGALACGSPEPTTFALAKVTKRAYRLPEGCQKKENGNYKPRCRPRIHLDFEFETEAGTVRGRRSVDDLDDWPLRKLVPPGMQVRVHYHPKAREDFEVDIGKTPDAVDDLYRKALRGPSVGDPIVEVGAPVGRPSKAGSVLVRVTHAVRDLDWAAKLDPALRQKPTSQFGAWCGDLRASLDGLQIVDSIDDMPQTQKESRGDTFFAIPRAKAGQVLELEMLCADDGLDEDYKKAIRVRWRFEIPKADSKEVRPDSAEVDFVDR